MAAFFAAFFVVCAMMVGTVVSDPDMLQDICVADLASGDRCNSSIGDLRHRSSKSLKEKQQRYTVVEYLNGDGNLASMELEEASNKNMWHQMDRLWGATWKLNSGSELRGPFSIRMKAVDCGKVLVASNVYVYIV